MVSLVDDIAANALKNMVAGEELDTAAPLGLDLDDLDDLNELDDLDDLDELDDLDDLDGLDGLDDHRKLLMTILTKKMTTMV